MDNAQPDGARALFGLFEDAELFHTWGAYAGRNSRARLRWVLMGTHGAPLDSNAIELSLSQFVPLNFAIYFGSDCGLAAGLRDSQHYPLWRLPESDSNQIAHFLTAVNITYNYWDQGFIIGHELISDLDAVRNVFSYVGVGSETFERWYAAIEYDEQGLADKRDSELWAMLHFSNDIGFGGVDPDRVGNSLQDLRLSLKGYRFAKWVMENGDQSPSAAGRWLRQNLSVSAPAKIHVR